MKDIKNFSADKYLKKGDYNPVDDGVYEVNKGKSKEYVTSLSFIQEPEYDEGKSATNISQYPLEDILDKYYCYISDFYEELNSDDSNVCYLEFASDDKGDICKLREIIGKHVYNKSVRDGEKETIKLIIE